MKRARRVVLITSLLAAFSMALSCSSADDAGKKNLVETVKRYNSRMIRAYMEANLNLMADVATEEQIARLFPIFAAMRAEGDFMRAEQDTFEVGKVSLGGDKGYVEAEEAWTYWWQHRDTLEVTRPEKNITYKIRYHLVKENGFWKVESLENIE